MESFPKLKKNQVALMRADKQTGHVLDAKLELAINDEQQVYTIYDSYDEACLHAKMICKERNELEVVIYGKDKEVLNFIR